MADGLPTPSAILDLMMQRAEGYANFAMRKLGHVPPVVFVDTPEGELCYLPHSMEDERAKNDFANNTRLICCAYRGTAVVMALEAWISMAQPGETLDTTTPPSEAVDRREVVVLMGEAMGSAVKQKLLPIIRTDAGGFFGFGEAHLPDGADVQGRFTSLIPPKVLSGEKRMLAKAMLETMGLTSSRLRQSYESN